ncbi:sulfurtransferase [Candidatus Chloroploca sp. M-50]|uniref:Sulfurtransferase n=1 Tax=Candidatus Chloroploca mongolica TaxID=2528176 RepID=A0ABS4DF07_9CHLR|nr:sulfurtransferase [Candidatus Chloroploca mongolica]MBP1468035.1 sulfurtransferase [Candidatus Chloroploca mongolica]
MHTPVVSRGNGLMLVVLVALVIVLAGCSTAQTPAAAPVAAVPVPAQGTELGARGPEQALVSTEWLAANLDNPQVRVIEVSVVPGLYERGHIPGAVNFVWHTDFVDTVNRDIVAPDRFEQLARTAGINQDTTVVLYGDNSNWFAAWGAWIFLQYGANDVRLLDGSRAKWEAEGRELSVTVPSVAAGDFTVAHRESLRARLPDVLAVVEGTTTASLIDIRSADEFSGKIFAPEGFQELAIRAGHIPGAINIPWKQALNEDGTFKSVDELQSLYAGLGIDGSQPIITYCRIGERASHTWFVLSQILGYEVAVYDGSWTEWGNTIGVPIANPSGTVWGAQ